MTHCRMKRTRIETIHCFQVKFDPMWRTSIELFVLLWKTSSSSSVANNSNNNNTYHSSNNNNNMGRPARLLSTIFSFLWTIPTNAVAFAFHSAFGIHLRRSTRLLGNAPSLGFVGTGTIASAIVTGVSTQDAVGVGSIHLSERTKAKSTQLQNTFPHLVTVHSNNQAILEKSNYIFLTVLPQLASEVLQELTFDPERHHLISLVSTAKLNDLVKDSGLPPSRVSKMICLPSIARHEGVCLHCNPTTAPHHTFLMELFTACGGVVTLSTEAELEAAMVTTCIMGPMYGVMKQVKDWVLQHTSLTPKEATFLVVQQYVGAIQDTTRTNNIDDTSTILEELIAEQTPGGLNEQALSNLDQLGGLKAQDKVMDAVVSRIRGETDGSL